jgi:hypothetical protein
MSDIYNNYYDKLEGKEGLCVPFDLFKKILDDYFSIMINGMMYEKKMYDLYRIGPIRIVKVAIPQECLDKKISMETYWKTGKMVRFEPVSPGYMYRFMWYNKRSWYPEKTKRWTLKPCYKYKHILSENLRLPDHEEFEEYIRDDKSIINKPTGRHRQGYRR